MSTEDTASWGPYEQVEVLLASRYVADRERMTWRLYWKLPLMFVRARGQAFTHLQDSVFVRVSRRYRVMPSQFTILSLPVWGWSSVEVCLCGRSWSWDARSPSHSVIGFLSREAGRVGIVQSRRVEFMVMRTRGHVQTHVSPSVQDVDEELRLVFLTCIWHSSISAIRRAIWT